MGIGPVELGLIVLQGVLVLAATLVWLLVLIDCAKNEPNESGAKVPWIIIIALLYVMGAVAYLVLRRRQRITEYGQ